MRGNNSSLDILQRNIHDTKIVYQFPCFHAGQNRSKFSPLLQTRVRGRLRPRKIENPHEHRLEMIQRAVIKGTNGKEFQVSAMFPRNNVCNDIAREEVRNGYFSLVLLSSRFFARSSSSRRISQSAYFYATLNTEQVSIAKLLRTREIIFSCPLKRKYKYIYIIGLYLYRLEQKLHAIEYRSRIAIYLCMNLFQRGRS